jgi:ArsR family transcriptional regulator
VRRESIGDFTKYSPAVKREWLTMRVFLAKMPIAMNETDKVIHERRVDVFKALAHTSRLYIVMRLAEGERSVGDLTDEIGADISTVSKHLAVLRDVGLVTDRREGQNVFYSLACICILDFLHCVDAVTEPGRTGARRGPACPIR